MFQILTDTFQNIQVQTIHFLLLFQIRNKHRWRKYAFFRIFPSCQRFKATGFLAERADKRLVIRPDPALLDCAAQMIPVEVFAAADSFHFLVIEGNPILSQRFFLNLFAGISGVVNRADKRILFLGNDMKIHSDVQGNHPV